MAGIAIEHRVSGGIVLAPTFAGPWHGTAPLGAPLVLRHGLGSVDVAGLREVFSIALVATYYDDGNGGTAILYHQRDPGFPVCLMRTVRAGYEYAVAYDIVPSFPVSPLDKEMNAYAISLASRGRGLLGHGVGFVLPSGRAALCLGVSGMGKSTLARMMREVPKVRVLNDDRLAITREPDGLHLWSTPWPGQSGIAFDGDAPLGVVALIARADAVRVIQRSTATKLATLLATIALPVWGQGVDDGLALIDTLMGSIPIVELAYPLGADVAPRLVEHLSEIAA